MLSGIAYCLQEYRSGQKKCLQKWLKIQKVVWCFDGTINVYHTFTTIILTIQISDSIHLNFHKISRMNSKIYAHKT